MNIDEIVRLMLGSSLSFAIVAIGCALTRFILSGSSVIQDSRKSVQNIGDLSTALVQDYNNIRGIISRVAKLSSDVTAYIENPMKIFNFASRFLNRKSKEDKDL